MFKRLDKPEKKIDPDTLIITHTSGNEIIKCNHYNWIINYD